MRRKITIAIIIMAALLVPLWAQTEANFTVTRTEDGRGIRINGYSGTVTAVRIPATIQDLPVREIYILEHEMAPEARITTVTIPASVTSIESSAFNGCRRLTSITVDGNNPNYSSENGILYNKEKTTLIAVPQTLNGTVSIPASVTSIMGVGGGTFFNSTGITGIMVDENNLNYSSENGILYDKAKTEAIRAPGGISGTVSIPTSVTKIGDGAFLGCARLTAVNIPEGVMSIGQHAFGGCTSITNISVPANVRSIGIFAFSLWTNRQTITVQGHANHAATDAAWGSTWRTACNARIIYQGQ